MNKNNFLIKRILLILLCIVVGSLFAYTYSHFSDFFNTSDEQLIAEARSLDAYSNEIDPFWESVIEREGAINAYKFFEEAYSDYDSREQHSYAHVFGEALYNKVGIQGISVCDSNYSFGCYHAFFGTALVDEGLSIVTDLDQACIEAHGEKGLGCQHGIGHGIIAELGRENINQSLEVCSTLNWQGPIGGCTSGVFMEFNLNTMNELGPRKLDENGLYYPCEHVPSRFTEACYFEQPAWWVVANRSDYEKVGKYCSAIENDANRIACFQGTGNIISGVNLFDVPKISSSCANMPTEEGEFRCIEGAVWILSNNPQFKDTWKSLCEPYKDTNYYERCIASKELI